jgi:hypothetical protein
MMCHMPKHALLACYIDAVMHVAPCAHNYAVLLNNHTNTCRNSIAIQFIYL